MKSSRGVALRVMTKARSQSKAEGKTTTMDKIITVDEAMISTVAVEIKTLTIGKKQMTLAVYRQIIEEPIIGENCEFAGTPWGKVNYHPECDKDDMELRHVHVIWQKGGELRRSTVLPYVRGMRKWIDLNEAVRDSFQYLAIVWTALDPEGTMPKKMRMRLEQGFYWSSHEGEFRVGADIPWTFEGVDARVLITSEMAEMWEAWSSLYRERTAHDKRPSEEKRREQELRNAYVRVMNELGYAGIREEIEPVARAARAKAKRAVDDLRSFERAYASAYARLEELDHLFIAV